MHVCAWSFDYWSGVLHICRKTSNWHTSAQPLQHWSCAHQAMWILLNLWLCHIQWLTSPWLGCLPSFPSGLRGNRKECNHDSVCACIVFLCCLNRYSKYPKWPTSWKPCTLEGYVYFMYLKVCVAPGCHQVSNPPYRRSMCVNNQRWLFRVFKVP